MWSAIETSPGTHDWDDYDIQLDLAAKYGIRRIIAETIDLAPEWAYRVHAGSRYRSVDGTPMNSVISPTCAVSGNPGLCLDSAR